MLSREICTIEDIANFCIYISVALKVISSFIKFVLV